MSKLTFLLTFLLIFNLALPVTLPAQNIDPLTESTFDQTSDPKTEKKKDKDKVQVNDVFFLSLGINVAAVLALIFLVYYPAYKNQDYIFTFLIFNMVIFILTYVLNEVKISMGAAFGLFAVFSMLRYRTAGISIKDMTYLFIVIALGLIGAIQLQMWELVVLDALVIVFAAFLECKWIFKRELSQNIRYENIELIVPEKRQQLVEDLCKRTGLKIHRLSIRKIDFLRDTSTIRIYYYE